MRYYVKSKSNNQELPMSLLIFQHSSLFIAYLLKDVGLPLASFNERTLKDLKKEVVKHLEVLGDYKLEEAKGTSFDEETRNMFDNLVIKSK